MKALSHLLRLAVLTLVPVLTQCASVQTKDATPAAQAATGKPVVGKAAPAANATAGATAKKDDLEEYEVVVIADPLERLNRGTFWVNDKLYLVIFRPISKGYSAVFPKPVRRGIDNAFENVKFPVRLVSSLLQGKVKGAGLQTEKFLVNTVGGIGGLFRLSDKIPALADLPDEDFGKAFASWGIGHGAYIVLPFLGPSSVRDGIGLIGDYAANPVNWGYFSPGKHDWTMIPPAANTLRALPTQLDTYDGATKDAIDRYISVRSAYVQYRADVEKK